MDQAIWRILALSSTVILAACSIQPRVVERAPTKAGEAGKVGVSVISVAPDRKSVV